MTSASIFSNAWFYKSAISEAELITAVSKAATMPYVKASDFNSRNRLIISSCEDYLHPDFLLDTIGAKSDFCMIFVKINRCSLSFENLALYKILIRDFLQDDVNNNFIDSFESISLEAELFFNKAPIMLKFNYFFDNQKTQLCIFPFGKYVGSTDSNLHLCSEDGIGKEARNRVEKFLSECGITTFDHIDFNGKTACINFLYDNLVNFIDKLLLSKSIKDGPSCIDFNPPITTEIKLMKFVLDKFLNFGSSQFNVSFCPRFDISHTSGFIVNDVKYFHDNIGPSSCYDRKPFIQEYSDSHQVYLINYVNWLNKISNLVTVSGHPSCYALLGHRADSCALVTFPCKEKFVIAIVPYNYNSKITPDLDLFSIIGDEDDWLEGKIPADKEYFPSDEIFKIYRCVGESDLPKSPPYEFTKTDVYINKAIHRIANQKTSQNKSKSINECSLDEQLKKMKEAGLVLSPGITTNDFLITESEEFYRANPYSFLCWQLTNRNEEGVPFCPMAFQFDDYDLPEKELMLEFQRICGFLSITIANIESEDYQDSEEGIEDEEAPEGLKIIRFTANGEKVIWHFGADVSFNKRYEWLKHAQEFFRQRFSDMLIYEISGVDRMLCLSSAVAEKINKLIKVYVVN